jgi:aminopeptidase N
LARFKAADNITDSTAAISAGVHQQCPVREEMLSTLFKKWDREKLVMLKWLTMHVMPEVPGNLQRES